ncbi:MAG: response regulator [Deinococcus-Thermus bacterium]|jgi:two-component system phosphate regulon response regulator PhoB|nr:response regulator [Deinococcota bacterium]
MTARTPETTPGDRARVLVVEDEPDQQELLRFNLSRDGYDVACANDGREAMDMIRNQAPDLVVLDLMLPGMDGLEVCKQIRRESEMAHLPIVMLTAKAEDSDVVTGLELGADDYVTKPYSPRVLLARVKAVLRGRHAKAGEEGTGEQVIRHKDLVIRPDRFEVTIGGEAIKLSGTEFRMLALLASRPGRVFTRAQIIKTVHGDNCAVTDRSVDVHIFWLRQKLGARGRLIEAVRGVGYRFREAEN